MKKLIILLLTLTLILGVFASCDKGASNDSSDTTSIETSSKETTVSTSTSETEIDHVVRATIIEIDGNVVLIEPVEGEWELKSADRIWINVEGFDDIGAKIGSIVDVTYDGYIRETYPAQITASKWEKVSDPVQMSDETTTEPITDETEEGTLSLVDQYLKEAIEKAKELEAKEYNYTIKKINGGYYMDFDEYDSYPFTFSGYHYISLPSLSVLKYDVPNGTLSNSVKQRIVWEQCFGDPPYEYGCSIYDIEHVWQPAFPDGWTVDDTDGLVHWYLYEYWFYLTGPNGEKAELHVVHQGQRYNLETFTTIFDSGTRKVLMREAHSSISNKYSYDLFVVDDLYRIDISIQNTRELTNEELLAFGVSEYS